MVHCGVERAMKSEVAVVGVEHKVSLSLPCFMYSVIRISLHNRKGEGWKKCSMEYKSFDDQ